MSRQTELRQQITDKIVKALKAGTAPWRKPWGAGAGGAVVPTNAVTKKPYRGVNVLLLQLAAQEQGFQSMWFATFKQWQSVGGRVQKRPETVRPGGMGTKIALYFPVSKLTENDDGEEEEERFFVLRSFVLFNLDQVDGAALDHLRAPASNATPIVDYEPANKVIESTDAIIRFGGDRAFYDRLGDYIQMPPRETFVSAREFYATSFHELVHWSECRLKWKGSYALGELIAEIGACFTCNSLHVPQSENMENHHSYLASWLRELENDHSAIFRASSQASKATDFILSFTRNDETGVADDQNGGVIVRAG